MSTPKIPAAYTNGDSQSFGYLSARKRWPVIVTQALDDVHQTVMAETDESRVQEGKHIISAIGDLKYAIQHDHVIEPLPETASDIKLYNDELEKLGKLTWLSAPWLYSECYLYRYIHCLFEQSKSWKSYDLFRRQKDQTFQNSEDGVVELAIRYSLLAKQLEELSDESALNVLFHEFIDIALWGNATDLSLLTNVTIDEIKSLQGANSRKENEKNILVNDIDDAFKALSSEYRPGKRVDLVLDNAGFELYADLILALFLLDSHMAETIVLHPKNMPWFVSDVIPADIPNLFTYLASSTFFKSPKEELRDVAGRLAHYHSEGKLIIRPSAFWTTFYPFCEISPTGAGSAVYEDLLESSLVIFKGDLNYRKLTADVEWEPTTPFKTAIGALADGGVKVLALRTCKANVVVGLEEGVFDRVSDEWALVKPSEPKHMWTCSGKYAVVEFNG